MNNKAPAFWAKQLEESRVAFGKPGLRNFFGLLKRSPAEHVRGLRDPLPEKYLPLAQHGQVVWASHAQVNSGMLQPGFDDLPGVTVYSPDPYYDQHPEEICEIAQACFQLKMTVPADKNLRAVADRMTDEFDSTPRQKLPSELTGGRGVYIAATYFSRTRLPGGYLQGHFFPLVIAPQHSEYNMVPALSVWPRAWKENWQQAELPLALTPCASRARQVVAQAAKTPFQDPLTTWDWNKQPVYCTPRAKQKILEFRDKAELHTLIVNVLLDGPGQLNLDIVGSFEQDMFDVFEQQGFVIIIFKKLRPYISQVVLDYADNPFHKGLWLRQHEE